MQDFFKLPEKNILRPFKSLVPNSKVNKWNSVECCFSWIWL